MNIVAFIDISGGSGGGLQQTLGVVNILNKFKSKNFNIEFCCSTKNAINYLNSLLNFDVFIVASCLTPRTQAHI